MDARLRVVYLLASAVGVFFLRTPWQVTALLGLQLLLWFLVRLPLRRLVRQTLKLWGFGLLVVSSYALTADDPSLDRWVQLPLFGVHLSLNISGAGVGGLMVLRLVTVVLASSVARAGNVRALALGLSQLRVPRSFSAPLDAVLSLTGEDEDHPLPRGEGRGEGRESGGGRGNGGGRKAKGSFWAALQRVSQGDVSAITDKLERQIGRAEKHLHESSADAPHPNALPEGEGARRDWAVIAGVAASMLGIRALKILPSIPFAPGHKLVLLTPLYVVASMQTKGRWGGTLTGLTMGTVAFLLGDGRYGVFEILKHLVPGVLCDIFLPLLPGAGRKLGGLGWSLFGGLVAAGRFATILAITFVLQTPAVAWAILLPGLTVHMTFGLLSGYITAHLVKAVEAAAARRGSMDKEAA
ncbi:MAG: hypothetical protein ACOZIN_15580 [Myxococcota bacterium]